MDKILSKSEGELPHSSMTLNGKEVPFQCSYKKEVREKEISFDEADRIRSYYYITCKFEEVVPIFNMDLRDMNTIRYEKTERIFFPIIGGYLAPPSEFLFPIDEYLKRLEDRIEREKQIFLDEGRVAPEEYIDDLVDANYEEILTEFTFRGKIASLKGYDWKKGEITHKKLYSDMSDEEREERFLMEDVYWTMKKVIGNTQLVKIDREKKEIIGGPF